MKSLGLSLAATLIGPLTGLITKALMDFVDDVLQWTGKLPDWGKRSVVAFVATIIPLVNAQWGLELPADVAGLLSQPTVQSLVGFFLAIILKGKKAR